jgi:hypothetical protein
LASIAGSEHRARQSYARIGPQPTRKSEEHPFRSGALLLLDRRGSLVDALSGRDLCWYLRKEEAARAPGLPVVAAFRATGA